MDTVFKTKYCSSYLYTNFVYEMCQMKCLVYFGTHIYSNGHEYAPWQYERMPKKTMVNRLIRTSGGLYELTGKKMSCVRFLYSLGFVLEQNRLTSITLKALSPWDSNIVDC